MKTQLNSGASTILAQQTEEVKRKNGKRKASGQTAKQTTPPTQLDPADQADNAAFAALLRAYEQAHATGADTTAPLYALATAAALSVLKKVIDPQRKTAVKLAETATEWKKAVSNSGLAPALTAVRRGILADLDTLEKLTAAHNAAYALQYNAAGDLVQVVVDKNAEKAAAALQSETLSDGLDLVNAAVVAILEQTAEHAADFDRADLCDRVAAIVKAEWERTKRPDLYSLADYILHGIESGWTLDAVNHELAKHGLRPATAWIETTYLDRRLAKKVLIKADDAAKWETVETSPIREVYRAIRREVQNSRAVQTDPRNGYLYIEDTIADPDSTATDTFYRRLHKWADLGGFTQSGHYDPHGNAARSTIYTADAQTAADYNSIVAALNLTERQATVIRLRMSGYGYAAIATYLGIHRPNVIRTCQQVQAKAEKIGFTPDMWAEMTAEN